MSNRSKTRSGHFQRLELRIKMQDEKALTVRPEEKHFPRKIKECPKIMHQLKKTIFA